MAFFSEASTENTFFSKSFEENWKLEQYYHEQRNLENTGYDYPALNKPLLKNGSFKKKSNICRWIKYSNDGKCIVSVHDDFAIRLYLTCDRLLTPFNRIFLRNSILCSDLNPGFSLYDSVSYQYNLNNIIVSQKQLPLKLISLTQYEDQNQAIVMGSYHFKDLQNDRYFDTYSLKFINENNFIAASRNIISVFNTDCSNPISTIKLKSKQNNINYGLISCVENCFTDSSENRDLFYFGTYLNMFSMLDIRNENVIHTRSLALHKKQNGIYQILQKDSYVYVLSRKSNEIPVLDKRMNYALVKKLKNWQTENADRKSNELMNVKNNGVITPSGKLVVGNQFGQIKIWNLSESETSPCKTIRYSDELTCIGSVDLDPKNESCFIVSQGNRLEDSIINNNKISINLF